MLIIILFVISVLVVFIYTPRKYSWDDFSNRFGNHVGKFGVYDLNSKTVESTYVTKHITDRYDTLFNCKRDENITYMLKLASENATAEEMKIIQYIKPLIQEYEHNNLIIRIQTNPWRYAPHFDAMDQITYMLHGEKKWIMWNVDFEKSSDAISFRDDINNLNYEQLELYLKRNNIIYLKKIQKPHESIFIKRDTWHYVENINKTKGCIMLNVHHPYYSSQINEKFKILWPTQFKRCLANQYY
tara:strand:- start:89 stop:817 length:729 start_codon:yes stop_codon:yes gene_type:complete